MAAELELSAAVVAQRGLATARPTKGAEGAARVPQAWAGPVQPAAGVLPPLQEEGQGGLGAHRIDVRAAGDGGWGGGYKAFLPGSVSSGSGGELPPKLREEGRGTEQDEGEIQHLREEEQRLAGEAREREERYAQQEAARRQRQAERQAEFARKQQLSAARPQFQQGGGVERKRSAVSLAAAPQPRRTGTGTGERVSAPVQLAPRMPSWQRAAPSNEKQGQWGSPIFASPNTVAILPR